jgi:hypothetical protein
MIRHILLIGFGALWTWVAAAAEEKFETLTVSGATYSNVTVLNKTSKDLFIKHAHGFANIKVHDLEPDTQLKLGYVLAQPEKESVALMGPNGTLTQRMREFEEKMRTEAEQLQTLDPRIVYGGLAFLVLLWVFFCFILRQICVKTANKPSLLVWFPVLQWLPLIKAAGMSVWWFVLSMIPGLNLISYVTWCFKIARARGKSAFVGFLLLLPVLNLLALLYLAFSKGMGDGAKGDQSKGKSNLITLDGPQRRQAV